MRSRWVAIVLGLALVAAASAAAPAASEPRAVAGNLEFQGDLGLNSTSVPCPADVPPNTTVCRAHTLAGSLRLSSLPRSWAVSEATYTLPFGIGPPTCPAGLGKPLGATGRLIVAGKGEVMFTLAEGERCVGVEHAWSEPQGLSITVHVQEFAITGGTGAFAGASGSGKVERWSEDYWLAGYLGETWTGTLTAPGLHVTLPRLTGAVAKTVRAAKGAKSARVTFEVTATDDGGGDIPVSCYPSSGSRFPLGTTTVFCAARDSSGNTATAEFTVTVKRGR